MPCKHRRNTNIDLLTAESRKKQGRQKGQTIGISQDFSALDSEDPSQTGLILKEALIGSQN